MKRLLFHFIDNQLTRDIEEVKGAMSRTKGKSTYRFTLVKLCPTWWNRFKCSVNTAGGENNNNCLLALLFSERKQNYETALTDVQLLTVVDSFESRAVFATYFVAPSKEFRRGEIG